MEQGTFADRSPDEKRSRQADILHGAFPFDGSSHHCSTTIMATTREPITRYTPTRGSTTIQFFRPGDTYRAEHPLFTLIAPNRMSDFVNTMLAIFDEQGVFADLAPETGYETGTMVGISSLQIIAEAYLKGFRGFDAERAFCSDESHGDVGFGAALNYVQKLQPIPSDARIGRPVANALELAIGDGSIALMAKAMGKTEDYEYFKKRAEKLPVVFRCRIWIFPWKDGRRELEPQFRPAEIDPPVVKRLCRRECLAVFVAGSAGCSGPDKITGR